MPPDPCTTVPPSDAAECCGLGVCVCCFGASTFIVTVCCCCVGLEPDGLDVDDVVDAAGLDVDDVVDAAGLGVDAGADDAAGVATPAADASGP